jgi:tyrosyl-tRNA synthetase
VDLLVEAGVASSKGEARRLLAGGGVYLNGERIDSVDRRVHAQDAIDGEVLLLRKGRKDNHVVRLVG